LEKNQRGTGGGDARSLGYPLPDMNMSDRDIGKYLDYSELELIAADPDDVD